MMTTHETTREHARTDEKRTGIDKYTPSSQGKVLLPDGGHRELPAFCAACGGQIADDDVAWTDGEPHHPQCTPPAVDSQTIYTILKAAIETHDDGDGAPAGDVVQTAIEELDDEPTFADLGATIDRLERMGEIYQPTAGVLRRTATDGGDPARAALEDALDHAEHPRQRYLIREALQYCDLEAEA